MYTNRSSLPFGIKPVGFGAAMIVNGALIAGLYFFIAPTIGPMIRDTILDTRNIPIPPPPPPVQKPKPTTEAVREPQIYTPPVANPLPTDLPPIKTTADPPITPQTPDLGKPEGTAVSKPVDPPPPPLIIAQIDPRYAGQFQPDYPASEIARERDGKVAVRVLIGVDGRVKAVEQLSATSPAFFDATRRQALSKWRFKPATRGGTPEESWKVMNVRFEMKNL
ncbi:energy transducer TonB [Sphingomonas sp. LB-2]|uniref:energy transducer TonB n=1 Tax=Sphingomonas caeni TaxID=2984949 RepID=UPI0022314230|nr:energy transducer TonB [Sphingomonas caeni]MCW3846858.1 energy transducer TonB [Sphingomonas caeni]